MTESSDGTGVHTRNSCIPKTMAESLGYRDEWKPITSTTSGVSSWIFAVNIVPCTLLGMSGSFARVKAAIVVGETVHIATGEKA